jgi:hypothetical protein
MLQKQYLIFLLGVLMLFVGIADLLVSGEMGRAMVILGTIMMTFSGNRIYGIEIARKASK